MLRVEVDTMDRAEARACARRQQRVAQVVWGSLFLVMGVLFTLHDMGRIDLGSPRLEFVAEKAVDGDDKTRWSSDFRDGQWLSLDFGVPTSLNRVRMYWEAAYAKDYELQVSNDGAHWTTARRVTEARGGIEEQELGTTTRYLRLLCTRRATPYGVSLWELQAFDSSGGLVSQGKSATASSIEGDNPFALWVKFWPLVLVGVGLPLLLAPRDYVSQVFGMIVTALGAFFQLQALGYLDWGVRQTASVVLILAGVVILLQSQRRSGHADEDGTGGYEP
jgi:F5/8 type C domain/LiaF transmembrane domain